MAVDVEREFLEPLLLCTVEFVLYSLTEPRLWHTSTLANCLSNFSDSKSV